MKRRREEVLEKKKDKSQVVDEPSKASFNIKRALIDNNLVPPETEEDPAVPPEGETEEKEQVEDGEITEKVDKKNKKNKEMKTKNLKKTKKKKKLIKIKMTITITKP